MKEEHLIVFESHPFIFWSEKMTENKLDFMKYQENYYNVIKASHTFVQCQIFHWAHNYDKAIKYYEIFLKQQGANIITIYQEFRIIILV